MKRLAVLTSHPIQYQTPLWQVMAKDTEIKLTVFFERNIGVSEPAYDPEFGQKIKWDLPLLQGYENHFLDGQSKFLKTLNRNNFDALLVHGWNSALTWRAVRAAHKAGLKVLLRAESPWNQEKLKPLWKRILKKIILGIFFRYVDGFLAIGEENRDFYINYGVAGKKIFSTPYAVDNERFMAAADALRPHRDELRQKLGCKGFVVLFIGKLISKKRPHDVLRSYAALNVPDKTLVFVGAGALEEELKKEVHENNIPNVQFRGFRNQTEIPEYYAAADVFVLPSGTGETWGLVVNEAMCFGLPVVVSDRIGSAKDLARDNGIIFHYADGKELLKALQRIADSEELRAKMGNRSREIVQNYNFGEDARGIRASLFS